jgi:acetyl-CoA acyltransferase
MREAVIVSGVRTPIGKSGKGALKNLSPVDMGSLVVKESLRRAGGLDPSLIEDIILGCAFPEGEQGMNLARMVSLRAGLPTTVPGVTVNRFCSSGLQSIAYAAERIMLSHADVIIAGGVESMSRVPMGGHKVAPNPWLIDHLPEAYMGMGHTAEEVARRCNVTREEQDSFAVRSHQRAAKAILEGKFKDEIIPVSVVGRAVGINGKLQEEKLTFDMDEGVRPNTNLEVLATLRPAFHPKGSVTAGNASQTSDGAAAVVVMSREKAEELGLKPILKFKAFAVGGLDPDIMGLGPIVAAPKALKLAGLTLEQVGLFELNEAFASQSIQVIKELGLDEDRVNVNGGAIALGHPLGCTGTKLTVSLMNEMSRRNERYGVVTMCIGGGMGAAGVFELC